MEYSTKCNWRTEPDAYSNSNSNCSADCDANANSDPNADTNSVADAEHASGHEYQCAGTGR